MWLDEDAGGVRDAGERGIAGVTVELVDGTDAVIATTTTDADGGYNLVGFAAPAPGVFDHAMSTGSVLEDTLALARKRALKCHVLPAGFDLDTADDFALLRQAASEGKTQQCSRTILFLTKRGFWLDPNGIDA